MPTHLLAGRRPIVLGLGLVVACFAGATEAIATVDFITHTPAAAVYNGGGATMRNPVSPAAGQAVDLWLRIGYSFYYTDIAVYYTTDGTTPAGHFGVPTGTAQVLTSAGGGISFVRNEPGGPGNIDWWKGTVPAGVITGGTTVRYTFSAWHSSGGIEVFTNNAGCADGTCDDPAAPIATFSFTVAGGGGGLPWPGKGAPYADHSVGYPPVYFWKEEGVVGNNYMNVMIDQNGTIYDVYYPSAGCAEGMGTKNEGYVDGFDTFPPGLPAGNRGQMNANQAMAGLRVDGVTYWLSNESAAGYDSIAQEYVADTNVISTFARLHANGNNIGVQQYDFCPKGITFPNDTGGNPNRGIYLKRFLLTNNGGASKTIQFYFYGDFALNGGDGYDAMYADAVRGAMVAFDNTQRNTSMSGEYNPTSFSDYTKDVSVYLAASLKLVGSVGGAGGTPATGSWRDSSADNGQGWIGIEVTLPVGVTKEIDVAVVGGFDDFAGATGTYNYFIAPAFDWFLSTNVSSQQETTETWWQNWLAGGVQVDTPDERVDEIYRRGLLATALHLDGKGGGLIAGMHNGAYPFIWPRDAVWAAITFARSGYEAEAGEIYRFLRDVAYRDTEGWGRKGFWKQKYTTDGYTVWNAPQVDETSCYPWGARYVYDVTGDVNFLADNYDEVYEAALASSQTSTNEPARLYFSAQYNLVYSNNLWEDSWDFFVYSNASVIRGLEDAAAIANVLDQEVCPGGPGTCLYDEDAALFTSRANAIRSGLDARLAWNGENTDISHLGIVYPFEIYPANHARAALVVDRMNGVATDTFGNTHPIVNPPGEWDGLINRYWNDPYWNNGGAPNPNSSPWFLTTLWYGAYYAQRQDLNPGTYDIDNHYYRLNELLDRLGPIGLGAEQIAPSNALTYAGQSDFVLQTAWPNAWESMSFLVDAVMLFLDYTPDAPGNTLRIEPKLPAAWETMTFANLVVGAQRIDVTCERGAEAVTHTFTNRTGGAVNFDTVLRISTGCSAFAVTVNGLPAPYTYESGTGRVHVSGALATGVNAVTVVAVELCVAGDLNCDCDVSFADFQVFAPCLHGPDLPYPGGCQASDLEGDNDADVADFAELQVRATE